MELLLAMGLSCYTLLGGQGFVKFDTYGTIYKFVSIEGHIDVGSGKKFYTRFSRDSIVLRKVFDFAPLELSEIDMELPKPIRGTFELGINELPQDLHDNTGEVRLCFERKIYN